MIRKLPQDFVLGASTSAYQVEGGTELGGRVPSQWDAWYEASQSPFDGREASGFYQHYREDIARCAKFHIKALNLSLAWTRILKDEKGTVNEEGIAYYRDVLTCCREHGIEPYVALYHFDTPLSLFERGEWLATQTSEAFLRYAKTCFGAFGDLVNFWITFKDPVSLVRNEYVTGTYPPGEHFALSKAVHALHNILVTHSRTVAIYKSMNTNPNGKIGIAHRAEAIYPLGGSPSSERAAFLDDAFSNRLLLDAVLDGGYSPKTILAINEILAQEQESFAPKEEELDEISKGADQMDFFGVNYYASHFSEGWDGESTVHHNGDGRRGTSSYAIHGLGRRLRRGDVPTTDWDWSIFPHGLYDMLLRLHEEYPQKPIYIMENGLGLREHLTLSQEDGSRTVEDDDRIDYLRQHLAAIMDAMEEGVDVRGYFVWSMMDALSWTNGYEKRYGLFYVDYATQKRYPKKSAYWFKDFAKKRIMLTVDAVASAILAK